MQLGFLPVFYLYNNQRKKMPDELEGVKAPDREYLGI